MIILDTNVISEVMRPSPNPTVESWLNAHHSQTLFLTTLTVAEVRAGIAVLPKGRPKEYMSESFERTVLPRFHRRVLDFDLAAAGEFASIQAIARATGHGIAPVDSMIGAIARSTQFSLATRDVQDFEGFGITLLNPWH